MLLQFIKVCDTLVCIRYGEAIASAALEEDRKMAVRMHTYTYSDVASTSLPVMDLLRFEGLQVRLSASIFVLLWMYALFVVIACSCGGVSVLKNVCVVVVV